MNSGYVKNIYANCNCNLTDIIRGWNFEHLFDKKIEEFIAKDNLPIPDTDYREGYYGDAHLHYWLSGLNDFFAIQQLSSKYNFPLDQTMDYGGASGRVLRHFINNTSHKLYISDINSSHIDYINNYINENSSIQTIKLNNYPSIPIASNSFDFIYSYSVFTHIDINENLWLKELSRILKPRSYILITIHSEHTWDMLPNIFLYESLKYNELFNLIYDKKIPYTLDSEKRLVIKYNNDISYNCNVFHHSEFIHKQWSNIFEIIEIIPKFHSYQTGVLLRKK